MSGIGVGGSRGDGPGDSSLDTRLRALTYDAARSARRFWPWLSAAKATELGVVLFERVRVVDVGVVESPCILVKEDVLGD